MNRLITQYQGPLLAFFSRRSQNHWDAEELTQEVFCKILKGNHVQDYIRDHKSAPGNQEAYLYTVAWSVLRDKIRRDKVRHQDSHVYFDTEFEKEDPVSLEQVVDGKVLYSRFLAGLDKLGSQTRNIFLLSRYEGFTYAQIADHYGISVSAVEKHMMKALELLKKFMKQR